MGKIACLPHPPGGARCQHSGNDCANIYPDRNVCFCFQSAEKRVPSLQTSPLSPEKNKQGLASPLSMSGNAIANIVRRRNNFKNPFSCTKRVFHPLRERFPFTFPQVLKTLWKSGKEGLERGWKTGGKSAFRKGAEMWRVKKPGLWKSVGKRRKRMKKEEKTGRKNRFSTRRETGSISKCAAKAENPEKERSETKKRHCGRKSFQNFSTGFPLVFQTASRKKRLQQAPERGFPQFRHPL